MTSLFREISSSVNTLDNFTYVVFVRAACFAVLRLKICRVEGR